jgi:flagellar hook-length control protein FliK
VPTDDAASTVLSAIPATTAAPVDRAGGATTLAPVRPTDTSDSTPTSTPTAAAPPVSDQIAAHLRGVRRTAQGVHEATLVLEPEHLGPVRIRMQVEDGVVALSMAGLQVATTEALKDALPELRRTLAEAGLQLGTADVADASSWSDWNRQDPGTRGQGTAAQGRTAHADRTGVPTILRAVDPTARPLSPAHAGALDLLA